MKSKRKQFRQENLTHHMQNGKLSGNPPIVVTSLDLLYVDPEAFDRYFSVTARESAAQSLAFDQLEEY